MNRLPNGVKDLKNLAKKALFLLMNLMKRPMIIFIKVLKFDTYSEKWLDFILNCRKGNDATDYDLVIGGVANDKVFNTVELYFDGLIDMNEATKRLHYEKPNLQMVFRSEKALSYLKFKGSNKQ